MKHLREIKTREQNVEVENDLRGMGSVDLFKHSFPTAQLVIKMDLAKLNILLSRHPEFEANENEQLSHTVMVTGRRTGSHKQDVIRLLWFSIQCTNHDLSAACHLKVEENIRKQIVSALSNKVTFDSAGVSSELAAGAFRVDVMALLTLQQAGLEISGIDAEKEFPSTMLNRLFSVQSVQANKLRKLG